VYAIYYLNIVLLIVAGLFDIQADTSSRFPVEILTTLCHITLHHISLSLRTMSLRMWLKYMLILRHCLYSLYETS
jgi:hypothetical protein